jgi:hypothetical protein
VKNVTAASVSSGASSALIAPEVDSASSIFCGLKAGMLAESSEVESDRLPATRTKWRTRTISRLLAPRLVWVTGITRRRLLGSTTGGSRSALRVMAAATRSPAAATAPRRASTRSGTVAKLVSPSSAAKTAPPMRAAPHSPVRIVPENHCTEMRRRSIRPLCSPSTESGGSLPRSICSASTVPRYAPRRLP